MSQKKIPVSKASVQELRDFAVNHLALELDGNETLEQLRAKVVAAWDKDDIVVVQQDAPAAPKGAQPRPSSKANAKEFIVYIEQQDTFDGDEPVPLGCNGKIILVPRGRWCAVPIQFRDSLVNAVEVRRDPLKDGGLGPVRHVHRYPHRIWEGQGEPAEGVMRPHRAA